MRKGTHASWVRCQSEQPDVLPGCSSQRSAPEDTEPDEQADDGEDREGDREDREETEGEDRGEGEERALQPEEADEVEASDEEVEEVEEMEEEKEQDEQEAALEQDEQEQEDQEVALETRAYIFYGPAGTGEEGHMNYSGCQVCSTKERGQGSVCMISCGLTAPAGVYVGRKVSHPCHTTSQCR